MNITDDSWLEILLVGHCCIKNVLRVIQNSIQIPKIFSNPKYIIFENKLAVVHCSTRSPSIKLKKGELSSDNILRTVRLRKRS